MAECYLGLGANLNDPKAQLLQALRALNRYSKIEVSQTSSFYASKPMGPQDQPDYVNAVALIQTAIEPLELLDALQTIENQQGRVRERRWGERTLDLDILLYDNQTIDSKRLSIPHPGLKQREFVVYPLAEIAPNLQLPCGNYLADIKAKLPSNGLQVIKSKSEIWQSL